VTHFDKYLSKIRVGMAPTDIYTVQAVRLEESRLPGDGNAVQIAAWTGGEAMWRYDPSEGVSRATVEFVEKRDDGSKMHTLREGDWVLSRDEVIFLMMDDVAFREAFDFHAPNARYTCHFCLADMRNTEQSDNDKKCPNCGSGYKGTSRLHEFQILKSAGLVLEEDA
jgi:hypothetical protein